MREHLELFVEAPTAGMERRFAKRRESDAVDLSVEGKLDHVAKSLAADATRLRRYGSAGQRRRVEVAKVDDRNFGPRPVDVLGFRVAPPGDADARIPGTLFEHPRVANDQQVRGVRKASIRKHARALLGTDAGT